MPRADIEFNLCLREVRDWENFYDFPFWIEHKSCKFYVECRFFRTGIHFSVSYLLQIITMNKFSHFMVLGNGTHYGVGFHLNEF